MPLSFEWDEQKATVHLAKHRVAFDEACTVFGDPLSHTIADPLHSDAEDRYITLGESIVGRFLVVIHTVAEDNIRIISARLATPQERRHYERSPNP